MEKKKINEARKSIGLSVTGSSFIFVYTFAGHMLDKCLKKYFLLHFDISLIGVRHLGDTCTTQV
jgi:hypothetical protein